MFREEYDLHHQMPLKTALKCASELRNILVFFVDFCIEFQTHHGKALVSKGSYLNFKTAIQELTRQEMEWDYADFLELRSQCNSSPHACTSPVKEKSVESVEKKSGIIESAPKNESKVKKRKRCRHRKRKGRSAKVDM